MAEPVAALPTTSPMLATPQAEDVNPNDQENIEDTDALPLEAADEAVAVATLVAERPIADLANDEDGHQGHVNTDANAMRRSLRLAKKVAAIVPITLKAQINLCRHLGIVPEGGTLTDQALADYKAMFSTPLPPSVIEVLTLLFGLSNPQLQGRDEAVSKLLGPASLDDALNSLGKQSCST
ncbi:hypothetical protein E2562_039297 [Oryza meyeriana var. granulata]|uniref:Uncharacterized protein n=1 Tax=Oryza meyeriana var. granulata TaxID=110450 RepID=A0A6G1DTL8_9ORYZ|nr:hypothetical protein E2562_039297 [Oryza meyeriana var. granulata]